MALYQNEDIEVNFQSHNTVILYLGESKLCKNEFIMMLAKVNSSF